MWKSNFGRPMDNLDSLIDSTQVYDTCVWLSGPRQRGVVGQGPVAGRLWERRERARDQPGLQDRASDAAASARAETWAAYAADRPWVAPSPDEEAAATILRRRDAIRDDAARRTVLSGDADAIEAGLGGVVAGLDR